MNGLIWIAAAIFMLEFVHGERNPYKEALLKHPWESVQDYIIVRPGALMFYWLYYADGTRVDAERKPLVIWLNGGPGGAGSGIGNFLSIGPLTYPDMEPRNHTWVKGRNVLLLDYPVGTGFSFVRDNSLLSTTDHDVAIDLFKAVKEFVRRHAEFSNSPTYIFGHSYGGKICPRLAYYLHTGIEKKKLKLNLQGIGLYSAFVDPEETISTGIDLLYHLGFIDQNVYLDTTVLANVMHYFNNAGDYGRGAQVHLGIERILQLKTKESTHHNNINNPDLDYANESLETIMNTYVKPTLLHIVDQDLEWKYHTKDVYDRLRGYAYMEPSTKIVEMLLNDTKLKVAVFNGNFDYITPLAGASNWVHNLKWRGSMKFKYAKLQQIRGTNNGFYKVANQLSFWAVFNTGHGISDENPEAIGHILEYVMSDER